MSNNDSDYSHTDADGGSRTRSRSHSRTNIAARFERGYAIDGGYEVASKLGEGAYSTVWKVGMQDGTEYAVKVYRTGDKNAKYFKNEVKMLRHIRRLLASLDGGPEPRLIRYYGEFACVVMHEDIPEVHPCIRFELAGDHIGRILRVQPLSVCVANDVMRQVFGALSFLHKHGIIHT